MIITFREKTGSLKEIVSIEDINTIMVADWIIDFPCKTINLPYSLSIKNKTSFSLIHQMMNKKFATFGILCFITLVMLAVHSNFRRHFSIERDAKMKLFPPNPETPLPPSSSNLHRFKTAAINSDSEECSLIGR